MTRHTVSIVSEDAALRRAVRELVESAGVEVATFPTLQGLLDSQELESHGCFVFYPGGNTLEDPDQRARLAVACASQPGILIAQGGDVEMAVLALKAGIGDVVQAPYRDRELLERIRNAMDANAHK